MAFLGVAQRDDDPYDFTRGLGEKYYWAGEAQKALDRQSAQTNRMALIGAYVSQGMDIDLAAAQVDAWLASQQPQKRKWLKR